MTDETQRAPSWLTAVTPTHAVPVTTTRGWPQGNTPASPAETTISLMLSMQ